MSAVPSPLPMKAICKSVVSGDTLVLRSRAAPVPGQAPQERLLHLAYIQAPRKDEVYAVQSRDFLRTMVVGREVSFEITYSAGNMEFGNVVLSKPDGTNVDVAFAVVRAGAAKVREGRTGTTEGSNDNTAEQTRRIELGEAEQQAKSEGLGLWAEDVTKMEVKYSMPEDADSFMDQFGKGKKVDACIEGVNNGTTVRARIQVAPDTYQVVTIAMAGCRAPRATFVNNSATSEGSTPSSQDSGEPFGDEARLFTETRLLQRNVQVQLIALPPTPISSTASAPSFFIGHILHPAGNIAQLLVASGLARCVDQHAAYLGAAGMAAFRNAEKQAKNARLAIWSTLPPPSAPSVPTKVNGANGSATAQESTSNGLEKQFEGVVSRVWNAESISVRMGKHGDGKEVKLFLSSIRQPRATDTKLAGLRAEAAEFLRKKAIGKHVNVVIDYHQPKSDNFEAKEMATVKLANGSNLAEALVEKGYVTVIRHRQGDEDKSSEIDKLMEVEAKAIADKKGLHSGKEFPLPRIGDASESAAKANSFLPGLKRGGKFPVVVDYVASGSRFKLLLPKQDVKITLVLGGIRAPRTARNAGEKSEPYGPEAQNFVARRCFQRDAEAEVTNTDKAGGFIGSLYVNKENVAVLLAREGLARVDEYNPTEELRQAEAAAKKEKKNMWKDYDDEAEEQAAQNAAAAQNPTARKEYVDVIVSDVRSEPSFSFAVQILQAGGKLPELEKLMADFAAFHRTAQPAPVTPRSGDLVAAKFTADNQWYRAKVRKSNPAKKQAEVLFYDYGNSEVLSYDRLRPLDARFKSLPPQAKEASLSFIQLLGNDTEYGPDAVHLFRDLCEGRPLVANVDRRDANSVSLTLYDPDVRQSQSATSSINAEMVRNGLARVDKRSPLRSAYPQMMKALQEAMDEAKKARAGAFELGDFFDDD
ncbi:hypothetical protein P389DRAFT_174287 [Cystobasidium minutum MCA 4210]|uniref:uncharacterized protein n=1 Tax=Cystobasidium minutum MCA 4210 TaxID=1397322 RepID=UPI0034CF60B1|eukprot:jgi/Rhomi1/174287/fgenesh1_kg.7_\